MKVILGVMVILFVGAAGAHAASERDRFLTIREAEAHDPERAFADMLALAQGGYVPAMDRVGSYFRGGTGTAVDLRAARHWFALAVAGERPWSYANLARVQIELGDGAAALEVLGQAAGDDRPGARRLLGTAHVDRQFGAASEPATGKHILMAMAQAGNVKAARDLLVRVNWGRLPGPVPDAVVDLVEDAGLAGDARYAEAALIYLSRRSGPGSDTVARRARLAAVPGIRDRVLAPERMRLAAVTQPERYWRRVEEVLLETEADTYARAASTAFWINKNAWVRVLQKELRARGYYRGRINARMTAATIRAQNRFCRDNGVWSICASGPLRGPTVRAVAGAIAKSRLSH